MSDYITNGLAAAREYNAIVDFRARHRLSQEELGRIVARGRATISAWENGQAPDVAAQRLLQAIDGDPAAVRRLASSTLKVEEARPAFSKFLLDADTSPDVTDLTREGGPERYHVSRHFPRADIPLTELVRMNISDMAAGAGLIVGESVAPPIIPPALDTRLSRLGARLVPVTREQADRLAPVWVGTPGVSWIAEGDALSDDAPAVARVKTTFRTCGCAVSLSRRLVTLSGPQGEAAVGRALTLALGRALDRAALIGAGALEPDGLLSPAVNIPTLNIGTLDADGWREAVEVLETAGIDSERLGAVANPATKRALGAIQLDGRDLWRTNGGVQTCGGMPALASSAVPDKSILVGDFSTLMIYHLATVHMVLRDNFDDGRHELFAFLDTAIEIAEPASFLRVTYD